MFLFLAMALSMAHSQGVSLKYVKELPKDILDENLGTLVYLNKESELVNFSTLKKSLAEDLPKIGFNLMCFDKLSQLSTDYTQMNVNMDNNKVKYILIYSSFEMGSMHGSFIIITHYVSGDSLYKNNQEAVLIKGQSYADVIERLGNMVEKFKKKYPEADKKPYDKTELEKNEALAEKPLKVTKKFPEDLKDQELIVIMKPREEEKVREIFKEYPYRYKFMDLSQLNKMKEQPNKYILWPESDIERIYHVFYVGTPNNTGTLFVYTLPLIKDIQSEDIYFEPTLKGGSLYQAYKEFVKFVKDGK